MYKRQLKNITTVVAVDKGDYLLRTGEICQDAYFINKGLFINLYVSEKGDECVTGFSSDYQYPFLSAIGYFTQAPSEFEIKALEAGELLRLSPVSYTHLQIKYGRNYYDFQENTLVFAAPGQVIGNDDTGEEFQPMGWWLTFQPELLHGTHLGHHMQDYTFFSYAVNEALHLSKQERQTIIDCMMKIDEEIREAKDKHSNLIISSAIELLLNYCVRFYDRQFITRKKANKDTLTDFEKLLNEMCIRDSCTPGLNEGHSPIRKISNQSCSSAFGFNTVSAVVRPERPRPGISTT